MTTQIVPSDDVPAVRFDTKIAVLLRDDLVPWQELNVTAFLAGAVAGGVHEVMGEPYADADGTPYLAMFRQPVLVLTSDADLLSAAHAKALDRGLATAVFTEELFGTSHDVANRAAVRAVGRAELRLVGLGLYGPRGLVDKTLKGARLHA